MPDFVKVMKSAYGIEPAVANPKRILLMTLRHTGCNFFRELLHRQYYKWPPMMLHFNAATFNSQFPSLSTEDAIYSPTYVEDFNPFVRIHTEWESTCLEFWNRFGPDEKPIVITLERDLEKVKQSFIRRTKSRQPMALDQIISSEIGELTFNKHYKHHLSVLEKIKPDFVLSVDADDRDERLSNLASTLGVPLSTNWVPINQTSDDSGN